MFVLNIIFPISFSSITWLFSPLDHLPKLIFILSGFFSPKPQILALCFSTQPQKNLPLFSHYLNIFTSSYYFHIILLFPHHLIIVRQLSLFITLSISLSAQEKLQPRLVLIFLHSQPPLKNVQFAHCFHSIFLHSFHSQPSSPQKMSNLLPFSCQLSLITFNIPQPLSFPMLLK